VGGGTTLKTRIKIILCLIVFALWLTGCGEKPSGTVELAAFPLDDVGSILTSTGVEADPAVTSDGRGSLRLTAGEPATFRLYETGDIDVEDGRLTYQAKIKTADIDGKVYLEMWCHFPGKGEFFSRALHSPITGTVDWTSQETPFFLGKGENPDNIKLNLVIDGKGTAWIDDIRLVKGSL
jgi:hypothetical protein